ncbi:MAG TPA: ABC transporter ATP-binding protein [Candidatus Saccharimonadales bacterium]|nr:ABC transporter ATP-binding protein [Candidatus Saccharimonadales bacterium]
MPISSADTARPTPRLVIQGLSAGYGRDPIISDIDLVVGDGEVVSVIGANGAGKSTLLKTITGALSTMSGQVILGDRDVSNLGAHHLARLGIGYVPQTRDVFDTLTVAENLEMGGYLLPAKDRTRRAEEVLDFFPKLRHMQGRRAMKLSGGERKMVALARVLMLSPQVLVLDEPTAGLSPDLSRSVLRDQVRTLADSGTAILLVEQKAFEALEISNWAYVLVAGRTAVQGAGPELAARPGIREVFLGAAVDG